MIYWGIIYFVIIMNFIKDKNNIIFSSFMFVMIFFIGWRYEVGGDWYSYLGMFEEIKSTPYPKALFVTDFAYSLLNKWIAEMNGGIFSVNFFCALLFILGVYKLALNLKHTWITLFILFSYTLIAVGMGYTRQSVSLGFAFLAFANLVSKKPNKFIFSFYIFIGSLFHFSLAIMFVFSPLINSRVIKQKLFLFYIFFLLIILPILSKRMFPESIYFLSDSEIGDVSSKGAVFRVLIHIFPLWIYFFYRKSISKLLDNSVVIDALALFVLVCVFLAFYYSTLADRFNVYFVVFDLIIINFCLTLVSKKYKKIFLLSVIFYYLSFFAIWYFYSPFIDCCYQYKNVLIENWI